MIHSFSVMLSRFFELASGMLAAVAGLCLVVLMLMITGAVVMRYGFGRPVLGVNEMVQMTSVALIMAPFLLAMIVGLGLIIPFPQIALLIPNSMFG